MKRINKEMNMLKKALFFTFIMISLITTHSFALDVLEKEILKKNTHPSETKSTTLESKQQDNNGNKIKISPMPNHFFTDQAAADLYRQSLNPTNEEGLLEYFDNTEGLSVKTFKGPKSKEYLPPSTDDIRGFKIYKKSKDKENITIPTKETPHPKKMLNKKDKISTNNNCGTIQDFNERQKCLKLPDPFMKK
jgi:hypothetical protein